MARTCFLCGKKTITGNNVSHSHRRTKRKWRVNLQFYNLRIDGKERKVRLCSKCIKKQGLLK